MANPRKFSEKIALHNQKQAEETAKFEQIMREVSDVTARPDQQEPLPQPVYRESRNRSMGVGPMRPRAIERRIDTSPYLSPPPDINWRRTNSDSALHQSAMQGLSNDRNEPHSGGNSRWNMNDQNDGRPRSSCDVPRVPGINIYPSAQEPGIVQIPIGNNTGSLPDLTSVHFPSPLHTPLDQEADHSSSPYSSSPVSASPATLSPTSVPTGLRSPQGGQQFQFNRHMSPHHNSGVTLENNIQELIDGVNFTQTQMGLTGLQNVYQQQQCPTSSPSPTLQQPVSGPGYRSPLARPSPQSSPGLGGRHSAPSSPAAPSPIPDYYLSHAQATLLQQHFEQFSMMDSPAVNYGGLDTNSPSSVQMSQSHTQTLPVDVTSMGGGSAGDLGGSAPDNQYYTTSPSSGLVYPTQSHTQPNTPTSIPDIILTDYSSTKYSNFELQNGCMCVDFSNTPDDLSRQEFSKDLSNDITGTLHGDLFPSDDSLREGLGHLDFDGLQMLSDPDINVISDNAEDHFRLDRL